MNTPSEADGLCLFKFKKTQCLLGVSREDVYHVGIIRIILCRNMTSSRYQVLMCAKNPAEACCKLPKSCSRISKTVVVAPVQYVLSSA